MEQKQLDEVEDSYFGEEFVDEDFAEEEVKIEAVAAEKSSKKAKNGKKATAKKTEPLKIEPKVQPGKEEKTQVSYEEYHEPVNPWADEQEDDKGIFKEVSTWKAITGIALILLIVSLFTQGFNFTGAATVEGEDLSLSEAESRAVAFVNSNLLEPPFVATLQSGAEENGLYKVTIEVAGQEIDSYLTKDGRLFFPRGFEVSETGELKLPPATELAEQPAPEVPSEEEAPTSPEGDAVPSPEEKAVGDIPPEEEAPVVKEQPAKVQERSVSYKKWSFSPAELKSSRGTIRLTLQQDTSDPSFTLAGFTLAIPELGVEKAVQGGTTVVEFTVEKAGQYTLICASCEGLQKDVMTASLLVE